MKKYKLVTATLILLMVTASVLAFTACQTEEYKIENHVWHSTLVLSSETGEVVFCSEQLANVYPEAGIIDMTATAESGKLIVTDGRNEMIFLYSVNDVVPGKETIYYIEDVDGIAGHANIGVTSYADGSSEYTLIISFEERVYYFVAPTEN